jgi:biopolymer transport protein ExbB
MSIKRSVSRRITWLLLATVAWTAWAMGPAPRPSVAQDKEKGEKKAEAAPAPAPEEGKAAVPASGAVEGAEKMSALTWFLKASGLVGLFILGLSVYFVATIGRLFWELRIPVAVPPEIAGRCQDLLAQRNFKGVFEVVKGDDSLFSRLLSHGIAELPNGLAEARDVMERVSESIHVEMEKRISVLAVLGTLGPMIGLVGTLMGMIRAFSEIAQGGAELNAQRIALAISMALVITLEGVSLSVPAIWFFSLFRNRVSVITTNAGVEADQFLRHFAHAARAKTPAGAPAAGAASTATMAGAKAAPRAE